MKVDFYLFLTFRPNNSFFVLYRHVTNLFYNKKKNFNSKVLVANSCGSFREKGIRKSSLIAFESNVKHFLKKIKAKNIFYKKLNIVISTSLPKIRRNLLWLKFFIKRYLKIVLKYFKEQGVAICLLNDRKFAFNGCKLPKIQRKKMRRKKAIRWLSLFKR